MAVEQYENLVIGSGEAGKHMAWTLATLGQRTAIVERGRIGGACPNVACLPSKNVIHSAKVVSLVRRAAEFSIATGAIRIDMAGVFRRKQKMVDDETQAHLERFAASGAEVVKGEAHF